MNLTTGRACGVGEGAVELVETGYVGYDSMKGCCDGDRARAGRHRSRWRSWLGSAGGCGENWYSKTWQSSPYGYWCVLERRVASHDLQRHGDGWR